MSQAVTTARDVPEAQPADAKADGDYPAVLDRAGLRGPAWPWAGTVAQVFVTVCLQAVFQKVA